jgi:hypothetical protein
MKINDNESLIARFSEYIQRPSLRAKFKQRPESSACNRLAQTTNQKKQKGCGFANVLVTLRRLLFDTTNNTFVENSPNLSR